ncbi:MAG: hypothetical protein P1V97_28215 [Planctomycetota bacterium]|nr:hypothetical protein [Planctomycetota bacterium]
MKLPNENPGLFALFEAGSDLNDAQTAELLDYLESHPDLARDINDFVGDLQQLNVEPVFPEVSNDDWGKSFQKITDATLKPTPPQNGPTHGEPNAPAADAAGEGLAGSSQSGVIITLIAAISLIFLCMQITPDSIGPPPSAPSKTNGKKAVPTAKKEVINPAADLDSEDEPDVIIEDLEVSDDFNPRVTMAGEDGDITIIWMDEIDDSQ